MAAFSGFSVKDLTVAHRFYSQVLGLKAELKEMGVELQLPNGATVFLYQKENHQPATYTVLNFEVADIDQAIEDLTHRGIHFKQYNLPDMPQDEKGVLRGLAAGMGPDIAWFTDPSGNILSVLQSTKV